MARRRAERPLTIISPSDSNRFTRSRSLKTSASCHCKGKENGTPGSCHCKCKGEETPSTNGIEVVQTRANATVGKGLSDDDGVRMTNGKCNPSERALSYCEENRGGGELRGGALHLHQNRVAIEEVVAATPRVPTEEGSVEKTTRKRSAPAGCGVSRKEICRHGDRSSPPTPTEVYGRANPHGRDRIQETESTESGVSVDLQDAVARATDVLQDAYNKLYKKHQMLKMRKIAEAKDIFEEQSKKIEEFSIAAEALVKDSLKRGQAREAYIEEIISSPVLCASLLQRRGVKDSTRYECLSCVKVKVAGRGIHRMPKCLGHGTLQKLQLQQELERSGLRESKLLHELLQNLSELIVSVEGESKVTFSHDESGLEFMLERTKYQKK